MTTGENVAVVRRVFEEVWNQGHLARVDELFDPGYVRHNAPLGSPPGREAEKRHRASFRAAFPDLVIVADDVIAAGDRVVGDELGLLQQLGAVSSPWQAGAAPSK